MTLLIFGIEDLRLQRVFFVYNSDHKRSELAKRLNVYNSDHENDTIDCKKE